MRKAWAVDIPENVWEEVFEWCNSQNNRYHDDRYIFHKKYEIPRIWVYQKSYESLDYLIDLIKEVCSRDIRGTCPKCDKQIPQGNFAFCPFCGSSLEKI